MLKSFLVFVTILTIVLAFKDVSKVVDNARLWVYDRWWGAPLMFACFLPLHLVYEVLLLRRGAELDAKRVSKRAPKPIVRNSRPSAVRRPAKRDR